MITYLLISNKSVLPLLAFAFPDAVKCHTAQVTNLIRIDIVRKVLNEWILIECEIVKLNQNMCTNFAG